MPSQLPTSAIFPVNKMSSVLGFVSPEGWLCTITIDVANFKSACLKISRGSNVVSLISIGGISETTFLVDQMLSH